VRICGGRRVRFPPATRRGLLALQRRPSGAGAKPPDAALAEDRRGERSGKGALDASGGDQEDVPEALGSGFPGGACAVEASLAQFEVASKAGDLAVLS
jgi:hypothetical protein